jgi:hypothetical protein
VRRDGGSHLGPQANEPPSKSGERRPVASGGSMSRVVGLYQTLFRRTLHQFLPEANLEPSGNRSVIRLPGRRVREHYALAEDADGFALELEWFGSEYRLTPGVPVPFAESERRLIEAMLEVLDRRFRALYLPDAPVREDAYQSDIADLIIAEWLEVAGASHLPAALEALRIAALSTYENRRVSTGVLLLASDEDPTSPGRVNPPNSPRYDARLAAIKSLHRLCDGVRTLFLVDRRGELAWPVDVARWAEQVRDSLPLVAPCPHPYEPHARCTLAADHVALVLTPNQELKVFARGEPVFAYSDGRWRLLDLATKFEAWQQALEATTPPDLAGRLFQAALNLAEQRRGALFVVLRDPENALPVLLAPEDRIQHRPVTDADDPNDPNFVSPRLVKQTLHHIVRGQGLGDLDPSVLEAIAGIDGAVVTDRNGTLHSFGAILRLTLETVLLPRAVQGARTTAALTASYHGPVLKVSEDGFVSMFLGGRRLWEI